MTSVIGIDPSLTHTACWHAWGSLEAPSLRGFAIKTRGPKDFAHPIARLCYLRDALATELDRCATDAPRGYVFVEGYAFGAKCSREQLGEWGGLVRVLAFERGWHVVVVPPATLKAYVTGKGAAPKELMMLEAFKRWGYSATDNNDADAYALLRLGLEWVAVQSGAATTKRAAEVFKKFAPMAAPH